MGTSASPHWELFAHGADVGIRGVGASQAEAFEQAALALTGAITDPRTVEPRQRVALACTAPDADFLLLEFLNTLVFEMATRGLLFGRYAVRIDGNRLAAEAWGEPIDPARHQPAAEVKGATLTGLKVARGEDGLWSAQCIVDV